MGTLSVAVMRSATSRAVEAPAVSSRSSANSSPPSRAAVSPARMHPRMRRATSTRTSSPATWPNVSLIALKSSRSRRSTEHGRRSRWLRAWAWATRSDRSARFASLVRGSWKAWCVSWLSSSLRSSMSRIVRTIPSIVGSSRRLVTITSAKNHSPPRRRSRHSTGAGAPGRPEISATIASARGWSSGWSRSTSLVPSSSSGRYPRRRSTEGVWYRITVSSEITAIMSEEFCTSDRKRASLARAALSAERRTFSETARYWRTRTAVVRAMAPRTMPSEVWRCEIAEKKSVP